MGRHDGPQAMRFSVHALGCRVNQYDAEAMAALLEAAGHERVEFGQPAEVCVVGTCMVTAESERKSRQLLRRAAGLCPGTLVVAAGCLSQRQPERTAAIPGVGLVIGNENRSQIAALMEQALEGKRVSVSPLGPEFEEMTADFSGRHARANVKIQEGCDAHCTYCVIPSARGPARSRSLEAIAAECRRLSDAGCREAVLTGINLSAYGKDMGGGVGLADAVEAAVREIGDGRIRLGSLDPAVITEPFMERMARCGDALCRQFHLALQSGCDATLKRMGRGYDTRQYRQKAALIRRVLPGSALTTDVIAGFPGETEEEFAQTLAFLEELGFSRIHAFPYSARPGTAAVRLPGQTPRKIRLERTARLMERGRALERAYAASLEGKTLRVLFEQEAGEGLLEGYGSEFVRVRAAGSAELIGRLCPVYIEKAGEPLMGRIL